MKNQQLTTSNLTTSNKRSLADFMKDIAIVNGRDKSEDPDDVK